jgi:hypothetical protein
MNQQSSGLQKKTFSHQWTAEKLAAQDRKSVETIRDRALRLGVADLVELCEASLALKPITKSKIARITAPKRAADDVVVGYHFVCERGRGVTEASSGRFWSGSWVVAESNVSKSIQRGAYLALHEAKSEMSYRQGKIVDFRRSVRDMVPESDAGPPPQIEEGIEFLVEEAGKAYEWVGRGAGEKGYRWAGAHSEGEASESGPTTQAQEAEA